MGIEIKLVMKCQREDPLRRTLSAEIGNRRYPEYFHCHESWTYRAISDESTDETFVCVLDSNSEVIDLFIEFYLGPSFREQGEHFNSLLTSENPNRLIDVDNLSSTPQGFIVFKTKNVPFNETLDSNIAAFLKLSSQISFELIEISECLGDIHIKCNSHATSFAYNAVKLIRASGFNRIFLMACRNLKELAVSGTPREVIIQGSVPNHNTLPSCNLDSTSTKLTYINPRIISSENLFCNLLIYDDRLVEDDLTKSDSDLMIHPKISCHILVLDIGTARGESRLIYHANPPNLAIFVDRCNAKDRMEAWRNYYLNIKKECISNFQANNRIVYRYMKLDRYFYEFWYFETKYNSTDGKKGFESLERYNARDRIRTYLSDTENGFKSWQRFNEASEITIIRQKFEMQNSMGTLGTRVWRCFNYYTSIYQTSVGRPLIIALIIFVAFGSIIKMDHIPIYFTKFLKLETQKHVSFFILLSVLISEGFSRYRYKFKHIPQRIFFAIGFGMLSCTAIIILSSFHTDLMRFIYSTTSILVKFWDRPDRLSLSEKLIAIAVLPLIVTLIAMSKHAYNRRSDYKW
ncbi:MAG: hypothetical protein ACOH5I_15285 [Oligoflexus sp.]